MIERFDYDHSRFTLAYSILHISIARGSRLNRKDQFILDSIKMVRSSFVASIYNS